MSLTLDPALSAAQDELERHPIVELVSVQPVAAIPFDGEYFNTGDDAETYPSSISHSSGRLISSHVRENSLIILYTDTDRLSWTEVVYSSIDLGVNPYSVVSMSVCELSNGNVGLVLITALSTTYKLQYMIVSEVGALITSPVNIETYTSPNIIDGPFVSQLQDDSFLLVYSHYDGTDYSVHKRTSSNFTTWSASSSITLSGFNSEHSVNNPSLTQVASGDIVFFLDHVTEKADDAIVTNIFNLISSDNGATWGAPNQLTSYADLGTGGFRPYPAITSTNIIKLSYHEKNSVLSLNYDSTLWQNDCGSPEYSAGSAIHYDPVTKKLYVKQINVAAGTKSVCGIVVIDTETWKVDRNYNTGTIPGYSDLFFDTHSWYGAKKFYSEGKYVAVVTINKTNCAIAVINDETETIATYVFKDNAAYADISKNITGWDGRTSTWEEQSYIFSTYIDAANDRIYMGFANSYVYTDDILVGYIDLTEAADPITGKYTFHEIAWITSWSNSEILGLFCSSGGLMIINELNRFCLYNVSYTDLARGKFGVYDLTTGNTIREYTETTHPSFPFCGIGGCLYKDNHVYGSIRYSTQSGQSVYRGMCDIDIVNEVITYHRPSYATTDSYNLKDSVVMDENRIALAAWGYGVAVYNIPADSWLLYNNDNVVGFEPAGGSLQIESIAYNSVDDILYAGSNDAIYTDGWAGLRAISGGGSFEQGKYMVGVLAVDWEFTEPLDLSQGLTDSYFAVVVDDDDILWSVWVRRDISLYSIKWDKDQASLDLTPYLAGSVTASWDIQNRSSLSFQLSHGHLFDSNNSLSTLYPFARKGRAVTLRFGEKISDVEYWQNQGTFYIKNTKVSYGRGTYPKISISCEDKIALLEDVKVTVSDYYSEQYPEEVIRHLITSFTEIEEGDISIANFDTRHEIWDQIIDKDLISCIENITDHFGYFLFSDIDNKISTRKCKVSVDSVDHEYAVDAGTIINFTPDDNYSNFTNRIIAKGEMRDLLEVMYPEELITSLAGSGGWWDTADVVETVYFSEDKKKKCRNIRLHVIKSIKDFKILFQESKGTEYISYEDSEELYIEVTIEFPGLTGMLIGLLASVIAVGAAAVACNSYFDPCGPYIMAFTVLVSAVGYLLGQVATYEYEIYGRPVGEVKQTIQATANDEEFQAYTGLVLTEEIEDEFCYTVASCQDVADYELGIVQAQRKRIAFSKIAHLQDEIGDLIKIYHPYSNLPLNIFITSLTRVFSPGLSKGSGNFTDNIQGWNL